MPHTIGLMMRSVGLAGRNVGEPQNKPETNPNPKINHLIYSVGIVLNDLILSYICVWFNVLGGCF